MRVIREATAWDLIGWDNGKIRIKNGRVLYEAVIYNSQFGGNKVKLARLEVTSDNKIKEVSRWVDPDTLIEVLAED